MYAPNRWFLSGRALCVVLPALLSFAPSAVPADSSLESSIRRARDAVFPTLVHIRPVFDTSRNGRKVETMVNGSGVIVSADGLVVTNFHVAGTAKRMVCTLADRSRLTAELVGSDAATDLAVIRLHLDELDRPAVPFARFGSCAELEVGDFVMAMGSPLGLTRSLSLGVVSCVDRYLAQMVVGGHLSTGTFNTWIQTDAAINPGNSGGPLVGLDGRIVGINTRGYRGADNLGFAIPVDVVADVVESILADGRVLRSQAGLTCQPLKEMTGPLSANREGLLVSSVAPGSAADRAGLVAGDIVLEYDGMKLTALFDEDMPGCRRRMAAVGVDRLIDVVVRRNGARRSFQVKTEEWRPPADQDLESEEFGLTLRGLTDRERRDRYLREGESGVLVTGVRKGGRAARSHPPLRAGDVLVLVGDSSTGEPAAVLSSLEEWDRQGDTAMLLQVRRGHTRWMVALERKEPSESSRQQEARR